MRRSLALVALLAALGTAACGEDEPEALTAAELRTQLDRLCTEGDAAIERLGEPQPTTAGLADFVQRSVDTARPVVERAAALTPPEELKASHDAFIKAGRETLTVGPRLAEKIRSAKDVQSAAGLLESSPEGRRLSQLDEEGDRAAERIGARRCAEDG
jgi:hypothetical protein